MPSTLWTHCIIEQLKAYNIRFLSYVPDTIIEQVLKLARQDAFSISCHWPARKRVSA